VSISGLKEVIWQFFFYKGKENILSSKKSPEAESDGLKQIKEAFLKVLDNKNLSFLLGSGCSSYEIVQKEQSSEGMEFVGEEQQNDDNYIPNDNEQNASEVGSEIEIKNEKQSEKIQLGIPVMAPMAREFYSDESFKEEKEWLKNQYGIKVENEVFAANLETLLSALHSISFYKSTTLTKQEIDESIEHLKQEKPFGDLTEYEKVESIIQKARNFIIRKCLNEDNSKSENGFAPIDAPLIELYKEFYRKLLTRNPSLPRLNIFTTNYDLYSERAMDLLGIHYVNGFTGGITKFFNPAIFNYALAEKMDLSQSKWSVIDNFFYLYKIHDSVNWVQAEGENKLFKVKEIQEPTFESLCPLPRKSAIEG